jgi:SAM-dependent methyltransferase
MTFHVRDGERSLSFVSRPGVFGYGRLDDGARALTDGMAVKPSDRILDLGCGIGAVGVIAGLRAGPNAHVTFADSNLRAVALAEQNARANGLASIGVHAAAQLEGLAERSSKAPRDCSPAADGSISSRSKPIWSAKLSRNSLASPRSNCIADMRCSQRARNNQSVFRYSITAMRSTSVNLSP